MRALGAGLFVTILVSFVSTSASKVQAYDAKQFHFWQNKETECNQTCQDKVQIHNKNKDCQTSHTPGILDETKDARYNACLMKITKEFYACSHACNVQFCGPAHGYNPCRQERKF